MRRLVTLLALLLAVSVCSNAQAGWGEFWYRFHVDWHRMKCWPEPFQHADRQATIQPLILMTDAGWQQQNTLSEHFFDTEKHVLSRAGQLKVRWIATQAPMHRRSVFVFRAVEPEISQARVNSVRGYLVKLLPDGPQPQVLLTDNIPPGGSGEYLDEVSRQMKSSIPAPRLPEMQGGGEGG